MSGIQWVSHSLLEFHDYTRAADLPGIPDSSESRQFQRTEHIGTGNHKGILRRRRYPGSPPSLIFSPVPSSEPGSFRLVQVINYTSAEFSWIPVDKENFNGYFEGYEVS